MKREVEGWREIPGWEGGYDPKGHGYLEKHINEFHLRIMKDPKLGERCIEGDVNAGGCCERIKPVTGGGWERYYDYSDVTKGIGYTSLETKKIDKNIETVEDLATYMVEYVNAISVDEWVEECKKQEPSYFTAR